MGVVCRFGAGTAASALERSLKKEPFRKRVVKGRSASAVVMPRSVCKPGLIFKRSIVMQRKGARMVRPLLKSMAGSFSLASL